MRWSPLILFVVLATSCAQPATPRATQAPSPTLTPAISPAAPTAAPRTVPNPYPTAPPDATTAHVTRVVDGDTIVLSGIPVGKPDHQTPGRYARLIGIDTPEIHGSVECFGREASDFTTRVLDGKDVRVAFDLDATDRYSRALVYVWEMDGTFFNARLVAEGYALQLTVPPNIRYVDLFHDLVGQAREQGRGLWRGCPVPD